MKISDDLRFICSNIDANLRYAEGKHTAFVAFNGIATFGSFSMLRNLNLENVVMFIQIILGITIFFLICAIITGIYSFIPIIIRTTESLDRPNLVNDNALFFEHIKTHSVESYEKLLYKKYMVQADDISPLDRCIISQVIVNSRLISRKFNLFKWVAIFDSIAVGLAVSGAVLAMAFR